MNIKAALEENTAPSRWFSIAATGFCLGMAAYHSLFPAAGIDVGFTRVREWLGAAVIFGGFYMGKVGADNWGRRSAVVSYETEKLRIEKDTAGAAG